MNNVFEFLAIAYAFRLITLGWFWTFIHIVLQKITLLHHKLSIETAKLLMVD